MKTIIISGAHSGTGKSTLARAVKELLPGVAESYRVTPHAMLSRGYAGVRGQTVTVNLPGSVEEAVFCT